MKGTADYCLTYLPGEVEIGAYSDADFASDLSDRRSTSGIIVCLGATPVIFASRKQTSIAQSSTEAEFVAANEVGRELSWLTQFLLELMIEHKSPTLNIDNQSTIKLIETGDVKRRSKHIEVKLNYIREKYKQKLFKLQYIKTENQPADILTKPMTGPRLLYHLKQLNCTRPQLKGRC